MTRAVSVVIPVHNGRKYIAECLESIRLQGQASDLEILVVDDGSTDGTTDWLARQPDLTLIRQANQGPAAARNTGIRAARGDFVAFLDADDIWPEDSLQSRMRVLEAHDDAALCFGDCRQFDAAGPWQHSLFQETGHGVADWGPGPVLADAYTRLLDANFITTGSVLARRRILVELGGFNEGLRLVEDLDLWLRIARRHPVLWVAQLCLLRRRHADNLSRDADAMSLAYLDVLTRHAVVNRIHPAIHNVDFTALMAREYLLLADRALQRGAATEAKRWARRCLALRPSLAALWRWIQGAALAPHHRTVGD